MKHKNTKKGIFFLIICTVLLVTVCVFTASCSDGGKDTSTGEKWTFPPDENDPFDDDDHHLDNDFSSDNVIDFNDFFQTGAVTGDTTEHDGFRVTDDESSTAADKQTHSHDHAVSTYDGVHDFPGEEFDENAYVTLKPLPNYQWP